MLTAHLWKEWREQRALLLVFVAVLATIAVGFGTLAPARMVPSDAELWFVIVALGAGFVALAGDLVPGEQRRGQLGFLLRTPGALRAAFAAKIGVLLVGLGALLAVGWGLGELCIWLAGGRGLPERVETLGHANVAILWIAAGIAVTAGWAFAVSCWLPRGASVLPATALTLGLVAAPAVLVAATYSVPVTGSEVVVAAVLMFAGGLCAAWLSFARGLRFGRRFATVTHGLAAALVFVVPSWVWSAERVWAWHHFTPDAPEMRIGDALLGADGRTAFVSCQRGWRDHSPIYSVAVELDTGAWRQLGSAQSHLFGIGALESREFLTGLSAPQPWIGRYQLDGAANEVLGRTLIDGTTGETVADCSDGRFPDEYLDRLARASRATTPLRLPDGSRAWFDRRTVVFEDADGTLTTLPWPDGARPGVAVGLGFHWMGTDGKFVGEALDLSRRRNVRLPDGGNWSAFLILPGDWCIRTHEGKRVGVDRWNPDTGERSRIEIDHGTRFYAIASDGRLMLVSETGHAALLDPDTGVREPLAFGDGRTIDGISPADWRLSRTPTLTPDGADVVRVWLKDSEGNDARTFARRSGSRLVPCVTTSDVFTLFAIPDDDHVLVIRDHRSLERWRFGSDEVEVLFQVGSDGGPRR